MCLYLAVSELLPMDQNGEYRSGGLYHLISISTQLATLQWKGLRRRRQARLDSCSPATYLGLARPDAPSKLSKSVCLVVLQQPSHDEEG
jgi:hypothetical protein